MQRIRFAALGPDGYQTDGEGDGRQQELQQQWLRALERGRTVTRAAWLAGNSGGCFLCHDGIFGLKGEDAVKWYGEHDCTKGRAMTDLIVRDRRPTPEEAKLAVRWLLWLSDWPEHDGPEMFEVVDYEDEDGDLVWLRGMVDNNMLLTGESAKGEVWRGLDRTGAVVQCGVNNG